MQIIVLGAHRSGTSMVTRLINMMGAYFGLGESSIGVSSDNPKGFWERGDVIAANDAILAHYGCAWDRLAQWQGSEKVAPKDAQALAPIFSNMKNIILEMDASRPWVMKDPRMCLTYPFWRPMLEMPVVVCVYRNPQEVARSLKTRNQFSLSFSMALWEYYATGVVNAIQRTPTIYVQHSAMLADPIATVQKMYDDLTALGVRGLTLPTEREITSFVDPALYRSRGNEALMTEMMTDTQKKLVAYVSGREKTLLNEWQKPSELASDLILSLEQFSATQERLEQHYQLFSEVEQRKNELESQMDGYKREIQHVQLRAQDTIAKLRADHDALRASTSWRLGQKIVRFGRAVTFKGNPA
ncbi:MAG: hypothetical protein EAZ74_06540 [Alphaproteobacteria bacterium]|nr:MAG: hypothetical protein EAY76_04160 [Alphaproteobacteria bacterium]TAF12974.1 MAG: hypothetical protein EAZ74_06540 [Alphaproteobacteria bacterium]TAF77523.1 MAG: hypothetical protein EAZ52_00300 [Alphaproteobacteria bacterium]